MRAKVDRPDVLVAEIAARQHGVVSVAQLRDAGLRAAAIGRRVKSGRLHRVHRGVYAVGHFGLRLEGRWMAAVLACGEDAVLSHRCAACLWGLLDPRSSPVDISIPGSTGRKQRNGIRLHRCQSLLPSLVARRRGIPVTTLVRTIEDLKRAAPAAELRRAIQQAAVLGLDIGADTAHDGTRSELEHRFLALCRRHRIGPPAVNVRVGGLLVDFAWLDQKLIVETDGYRFHRGRLAFENDRARDLRLREIGFDVVRLSYRQVLDQPEQVATALRRALSQHSLRRSSG
jgi:very-short-patch-repair endonuclease